MVYKIIKFTFNNILKLVLHYTGTEGCASFSNTMKTLCLLTAMLFVMNWGGSLSEESPTDQLFNEELFEALGKHSDVFLEGMMQVAPEYGPHLRGIVQKMEVEPDKSMRCRGCQVRADHMQK